jgi:hypothetical protein
MTIGPGSPLHRKASTTFSSAFVWLVVVANVDKPIPVYDAAQPEVSFQTLDGRTLKDSMGEGTDLGVDVDIGVEVSLAITGQTNADQVA